MNSRDAFILKRIIKYCQQIKRTCGFFGNTQEKFEAETIFQDACCMCILQIGELAGKLSDETKRQIPDIPWREIYAMRNVCAHAYEDIAVESVWATILEDIPMLMQKCIEYLESET